jgi:predicted MPP superfamily phosphohydrolase
VTKARTDGIHTGDIIVDILVIASQCLIAQYLISDAKPRLSRSAFRAVAAVFILLGTIALGGVALNLIRSVPNWTTFYPGFLGTVISAIELFWGVTSVVGVIVYPLARALITRTSAGHSPSRRRAIQATAGAAMAAPIAALGFGVIVERTKYQIVELDFPVHGLPPDFDGFTVAQISDLHISPFLSVKEAARVVDMTNELKPRLTLMTGDLISGPGDPLDATIAELARLRSDTGILGCLGNHERFADCETYTQIEAAKRGVDFLRLRARQIRWGNSSLNFAGVDYQSFRDRKTYLAGADKLIVPGMPNILLSHNPDVFPAAIAQGYDAVLSGHTHAGQVTVEILRRDLNVVRFLTRYVAGLYREGNASCYVTAGIGTIGMPVRLGAPPEITLLRLRRA